MERPNPIPVVIPLKQACYWGEEIRYCLRSLAENFQDPFEVYIIGYLPDWCQRVHHIEFEDDPAYHSEYNQGRKLKIAAGLFDAFIWMYDDIYFIKPVSLDDIDQPRVAHDLEAWPRGQNRWQQLLWATYDRCKELGIEVVHSAQLHMPYYYEAQKMQQIFDLFDIENGRHLAQTAYFNIFKPEPPYLDMSDKVGYYSPIDAFNRGMEWGNAKFLNHDNNGLTNELRQAIIERFPEKCRFEK